MALASCAAQHLTAPAHTGGERVWLYRPAGFDPARPEFAGGGAGRPEVQDSMSVAILRQSGSIPLWNGSAK